MSETLEHAAVRRVISELEYTTGFAKDQIARAAIDRDAMLDAVVTLERSIARDLQGIAQAVVKPQLHLLEDAIGLIEEFAFTRLGGRIPERYLKVKGYRAIHAALLAFLALYVGRPVPGSKLRMLTADQVHTERRVRELRDLGFRVLAKSVAGDNQYVLESLDPNLSAATQYLVRKNLKSDKSLSEGRRSQLETALRDL